MKARSVHELKKELARNSTHLFFGLALAGFIGVMPRDASIGALALVLAVGALTSIAVHKRVRIPVVSLVVDRLERKGAWPGKGALALFTGVFIAASFFERRAAFTGALSVSLCDSFSTIIGKTYGTHRIFKKKTLEGFVGGFLPTFILLLPFAAISSAFLVALASSITELLSPVDDNLLIPVIGAAVFTAFRYSVLF
ncbi:hypothetical protein HY546_00950 [archaeon]|nr:hypothetical protein [archaeon]